MTVQELYDAGYMLPLYGIDPKKQIYSWKDEEITLNRDEIELFPITVEGHCMMLPRHQIEKTYNNKSTEQEKYQNSRAETKIQQNEQKQA